ncbi:hypothetical protein GCM10027565_12270 [Bordetella tumulicola]
MAGIVTRARAFDLDHICAQIGQILGAPGASQDAAEIEDAYTFQGWGALLHER